MNALPPAANPATRPRHLAIIMDGNGRWALRRHKPRAVGHRAGARAVNLCIDGCMEHGIAALTLFAFSSENWRRPAEEIGTLMQLFLRALEREVEELHRRDVRLRFIGERSAFAPELRSGMLAAERLTAGNGRLHLNIAAGYGGRWDLVQATRRLAEAAAIGRLDPAEIDEARLSAELALAELPEPDLLIRTGGEQRVSNFLLWQLAYTELWFTPVLWPDFDRALLDQALAWYAGRERRYGRTSEQLGPDAAREAS